MTRFPSGLSAAVSGALLAGALATIAAPASAGGGGSCAFDANTHVATASPFNPTSGPSDLTVIRSGDNILVNGTVCGTVTTLDKMIFQLGNASVTVRFYLGGGPFAPGYTNPSNDTGEIEFEIQYENQFSFGQSIEIVGGDGNDHIRVGDSFILGQGIVAEVNLNASVDSDVDIFVNAPVSEYDISLSGGHDQLAGVGLGGPFSGPTTARMRVEDGSGDDIIAGGGASDFFNAGDFTNGADTYLGNGDNDFVSYDGRESAVTVTFNGVDDDGSSCPGPECEGDNIGDDILGVFGGSASDKLVGGPGPQILRAGEGHNLLRGLGGKDDLSGGNGNDDFRGGDGFDIVKRSFLSWGSGDPGLEVTIDDKDGDGVPGENDNVHTDVEGLVGTSSPDVLIGSAKDNRLYGDGGDDILKGGPGNDTLNGGNIFYTGFGDGDDRYFGGSGRDTVEFSLLSSHLDGLQVSLDNVANDGYIGGLSLGVDNVRSEVENVIGSLGPDLLIGSAVNNRLEGKAGDDTLKGLGGNDTLLGGANDDTIQGGPGDDSCQQGAGTGTVSGCE